MSRRKKKNLVLLALSGGLYLMGRYWQRAVHAQWLHWFLVCYYSDVLAGILMVAWLDLMLECGRRKEVRSWRQTVPFLLICGLVWECLAPLWKAGAVFDWWDFVAYQAGGLIYLALQRLWDKK